MEYADFKNRALEMYRERLSNGVKSEKARVFNTVDFPELDTGTFSEFANMLKFDGYITGKVYLRNFSLNSEAVEEALEK